VAVNTPPVDEASPASADQAHAAEPQLAATATPEVSNVGSSTPASDAPVGTADPARSEATTPAQDQAQAEVTPGSEQAVSSELPTIPDTAEHLEDAVAATTEPATDASAPTNEPATAANATDPGEETATAAADTTATAPTVAQADSARTNSAAVPTEAPTANVPGPAIQLPVVNDPRARWEISALGGGFLTDVRYTGARADEWSSSVKGERTTGFGAELMHMGRHIGLGLGVHYGSYAERITAKRVEQETNIAFDSTFWDPVDTTILVVLGTTIIDGQSYYIIDSRDTIIHVLRISAVERLETLVRRSAMERLNTWSYLELPLLFDAHTRKGRWLFGLRGGPSLCVLQGRRGVLPNAGLDGYTELEDEAYKELSIGYQARCYMRYQFHEAWSLGLEPTLRGQLPATIGDAGLTRRAMAVGGQFSVTYRLR
jgi:hypothetical protein